MTRDIDTAARKLLAGLAGDSNSAELADRAAIACQELATHLARLLGDTGVQVILNRSIVQASARFPWLATVSAATDASSALRTAMEQQVLDAIAGAFADILSAFVGLLERLIGEGLVERLLDEVWPGAFTLEVKDTP